MHGSPPTFLNKLGEAAVRRCAIGVLNWSQIRYQIHPDLSQMANLKNQILYARQRSYTPLFVSPQEPGDHRSPAQNFRFLCLVGSCWTIFSLSGARLKNDVEKTSKKTRKSRILASENPPKISPKCLQNRCPTKPAFFLLFLAYSDRFGLRALFLRSENLAKTVVLLYYEHISIVCLSKPKATKKYRKNLPKTLPKRGPNPLKIDAKNVLFFNIDFFRFQARLWSLLGLQD